MKTLQKRCCFLFGRRSPHTAAGRELAGARAADGNRSGQFQFTDPQATSNPQRFCRLRSP